MGSDETLSTTIIDSATALQKWSQVAPIVSEVTSLVQEYSEVINEIGSIVPIVGFVWGIYSKMQEAKDNAAALQDMAQQIILAVDGMIIRSTAEIKQTINAQEVAAAITNANAVQQGFRHDVLPYAKTFPLSGFDLGPLDLLVNDARRVIETIHALIADRAARADGPALIMLYRNLHAVVQCKLTMDKWRRGITKPVLEEATYEVTRLVQVWVPVVRGLMLMSDNCFSPGIVYFHVGGHGRPEFKQYSYYYLGKAQPTRGSDMAPVSHAFIEARKAARGTVIPQDLIVWNTQPSIVLQKLWDLSGNLPN